MPAEGEELLGDLACSGGRSSNLVDVPMTLGRDCSAPGQQVAESHDDGHHVVHFMGHSAGQPAHGLQALGATKPLLCPLELGEILNGDDVGAATRTGSQ